MRIHHLMTDFHGSLSDMFGRAVDLSEIRRLLRLFPVVALLGARQVGKTTLAKEIVRTWKGGTTYFDLEDPSDLERLADSSTSLRPLKGLVVFDEIQRRPELFPLLRVLADRSPRPARFLLLGSASPQLLRQTSESLAGRIAYYHLHGLGFADVGERWERLWLRGGFPRSYLERTESESLGWRREMIRTYLERDVPQLGFSIPAPAMRRFWTMLAHYHGQIWNSAELARAFGMSESTARRYLDLLLQTFMVQVLQPWAENLGKRVVKTPKVYLADTGLLHALLRIQDRSGLLAHPKVGASFEGFALQHVVRRLNVEPEDCWFWATHQGAELDLLVVRGRRRLGFEIKHTDAPGVTKSMRIALAELGLERLDVIHVGRETYPLGERIRAVSIERVRDDVERFGR
jgi:predicted AAA+ superfamily ATPase